MANRYFNQFQYGFEKTPVKLYATILFATTAAAVIRAWNGVVYSTAGATGYRGVKSITRNGTGDFTIRLSDPYNRLLGATVDFVSADGSTPIVANGKPQVIVDNVGSATDPYVRMLFVNAGGSATDPTANDRGLLSFTLSNSNVG